jgi:hypothetical protein
MLHERRLPQADVDDLAIVYAVKLKLLTWLLRTPPPDQVTKDELSGALGKPLCDWFWPRRIGQPLKRTEFGRAVDALARMARTDTNAAIQVADAIEHDARLSQRWDEVGFELQFPRLHPGWLDPVKNVADPFYGWLAGDGFGKDSFNLTGNDMTRTRLMQAFRPQSHGVCGYCDGSLGDVGTKAEANDCDHFFPKAKWPHLAIHPANLFASCKGCNETWKLASTPMGDADAQGLAGTYHPSLRPGVGFITVKATQSPNNPRQVEISIHDFTVPRRSETLVETLDLKARWTKNVNDAMDGNGVSVFVAQAFRTGRRGRAPTEADVTEVIDASICWYQSQRGKQERSMRLEAALQYQKDNHLSEILMELL